MGQVSLVVFFFQAEDGIRDLVRSRGLGDVYKRQVEDILRKGADAEIDPDAPPGVSVETAVRSDPTLSLSLIHI